MRKLKLVKVVSPEIVASVKYAGIDEVFMEYRCPECGFHVAEDYMFCPYCGSMFDFSHMDAKSRLFEFIVKTSYRGIRYGKKAEIQ